MAGCTPIFSALLTACILQQLCATQVSCRGRCGELFSGGNICTCDDGCRDHNDCCDDYENTCPPMSCRGRCGELFSHGKNCSCDDGCRPNHRCCDDYENVCAPMSCRGRCGELFSGGNICTCDDGCRDHNDCCDDYENTCPPTGSCKGRCQESFRRGMDCDCDLGCIFYNSCCPDLDKYCGGSVVKFVPPTKDPAASPPADADLYLPLSPDNPTEITAGTSHDGTSSAGEPVADKALKAASTVGQPPQSSSPDLCKGLPISGVASPFNGSIIVFKGHFFWLLDPKTREAGPARSITAALGIPSPIDTAFARCNCESETYIIKGDNYWSFRNGVMEPGYPRSVSKDFAGLSGNIVAALSVPATRNMPEAVFFFKKGGTVQKFTYPAGSGPTCTGKNGKNPMPAENRQPGSLSGEIDISLKWKGFPTPVTSALSMPNTEMPDGFEHYIFSGPNVLSIEISGDVPVLAIPAKPPAENDVEKWLNCPL